MKEHLEVVLRKLCDSVDVEFNEDMFSEKEWFTKHSWTKDQEYDFSDWMKMYLYNNEDARNELMGVPSRSKMDISKTVGMFLVFYGWSTKK